MLERRFSSEESSMSRASDTGEFPNQGTGANYEQHHPLMSFRPLTLLLAGFWMLVIASFASLRL